MMYVIIGILFVAILLIGCALIPAMPENPKSAKILDDLADKYRGLYIFDKKFYTETQEKEKEREEYKNNTLARSIEIGELREELYNHIIRYDNWDWRGNEGYMERRQKRFTDKEWLAWSKQRKKYLNTQIKESDSYYIDVINYIKEVGLDTALKEMDMILDGLQAPTITNYNREAVWKFIVWFYTKALSNYVGDEIKRRYPNYKEVDEAIPQVLSNGCKYYENKGFVFKDKPEYIYYGNKIKEYVGDKNYNILQHFLQIYSYYECNGKKIPIAFIISIQYPMVKYGLFGDAGRGFRMTRHYFVTAGTARKYKTRFFIINDKFVRFHEVNGEYTESEDL